MKKEKTKVIRRFSRVPEGMEYELSDNRGSEEENKEYEEKEQSPARKLLARSANYTNSSLVSYKKISPNRNSPRNHNIDTITIHCVVGQVTVQKLGDMFAKESKQASANYGVGYDGKIGLYCEEKDRSWCSSSAANDNRSVTVEVASDTEEPYAVTSEAYNATINLVADICKRNDIKKLVWSTDKNTRVNHLNGCNMTVHRDYASKSCPGTYLYNKMGDIAAKVNEKLGVVEPKPQPTPAPSSKVVTSYKVRTSKSGWLPEVKDLSDYAGIVGQPITDIAVKVSEGSVKYRVHIKGGKWLPYVTGYNTNDSNNGYAGIKKEIDAIEIYYNTPKGKTVKKAKYRVSPLKKNYYSWQYDNEKTNGQDGYAGSLGQTIDRLQVTVE